MTWQNLNSIDSKEFKCSYCGFVVATKNGYFHSIIYRRIYVCPHCEEPTYFNPAGDQIPDIAPGNEVQHLPELLNNLYKEARNCVRLLLIQAPFY